MISENVTIKKVFQKRQAYVENFFSGINCVASFQGRGVGAGAAVMRALIPAVVWTVMFLEQGLCAEEKKNTRFVWKRPSYVMPWLKG